MKLEPERRVLLVALIISVIAAVIAFFMGNISWSWGFLYGYAISALNFIAMTIGIIQFVKMSPKKAQTAAIGSYFGRMLSIAVAIFLLKFWTAINVWAAMLGFFTLRIAILLEGISYFLPAKRGDKDGR